MSQYTLQQQIDYWKNIAKNGGNFQNNFGQNKSNGGNSNNNQNKKKRSGAKLTRYVNGNGEEKFLTSAWRKTRYGFIKIKAVTTKDSKESDKGWFGSVAVTFTNLDTGVDQFHWGTMEKKTGKVVIDKLSMVLNPRAKNGGYAGSYISK